MTPPARTMALERPHAAEPASEAALPRPRVATGPAPTRRASDRPPEPRSAAHPWPDAPTTLAGSLALRRDPSSVSCAVAATDAPVTTSCGLPQDRHARVAATRALHELQQAFRQALGLLDELPYRRQLQRQIELARDPADLWLLRRSVLPPLQALGASADRAIWQLEHCIARSLVQQASPTV